MWHHWYLMRDIKAICMYKYMIMILVCTLPDSWAPTQRSHTCASHSSSSTLQHYKVILFFRNISTKGMSSGEFSNTSTLCLKWHFVVTASAVTDEYCCVHLEWMYEEIIKLSHHITLWKAQEKMYHKSLQNNSKATLCTNCHSWWLFDVLVTGYVYYCFTLVLLVKALLQSTNSSCLIEAIHCLLPSACLVRKHTKHKKHPT